MRHDWKRIGVKPQVLFKGLATAVKSQRCRQPALANDFRVARSELH
jgi:hypothetical protein